MARIIVIEDNVVYCTFICNLLAKEGFETEHAYHLSTARKLLMKMEEDDIVLADLRLPDGDSISLVRWMRENDRRQTFIVMTDYAEVHTAVESMKLGSTDYIPKQLIEDKLVPLLRSIRKEAEKRKASRTTIFKREGKAFLEIARKTRLVAPTRMSVLITGENGTGKEHVAQAIHARGRCSDKPFVAVDCGKGAFTGADTDRTGYFREAEGGTLFLDEIGNLSPDTQQMLLRVIQERRYRPVGAKSDVSSNVRIIAATNENLYEAVAEKRFRQDLLYRIQEYVITVPPLRDCQEDIMPLAEFFREQGNTEFGRKVTGFDASARKALLTHPWPGNVRELKQKILAAVLQAGSDVITGEDLELDGEQSTSSIGFTLKNGEEEKERIERALKQADGNKRLAAKLLGIGRTTLYNKLDEYGLNDA